jgi:hypothetical protein
MSLLHLDEEGRSKWKKTKKILVGIANIERRSHPRVTVDLPVDFYQIDSSVHHTGQMKDAGEGGLLVYLPERMEIGNHLKMKLFFSFSSDLNAIEALAEVVWEDIHLGKGWGITGLESNLSTSPQTT